MIYVEAQLIFCKNNANREQRHQTRLNNSAEMPLIFCKNNANREQRHQTRLNNSAEMPLIFCKDNASRTQKQVYSIYVKTAVLSKCKPR